MFEAIHFLADECFFSWSADWNAQPWHSKNVDAQFLWELSH